MTMIMKWSGVFHEDCGVSLGFQNNLQGLYSGILYASWKLKKSEREDGGRTWNLSFASNAGYIFRVPSQFELPRDSQGKGKFWKDAPQHRSGHAAGISRRQFEDVQVCLYFPQRFQIPARHQIFRHWSLSLQWDRRAKHSNYHDNCKGHDATCNPPIGRTLPIPLCGILLSNTPCS